MTKKTCGPMYCEALVNHTGGDFRLIRAFTAGFINGQAEKVHLGACRAAMFRPSMERKEMIVELVADACQRYDLTSFEAGTGEYWICRDMDVWEELRELHAHVGRNSEAWHERRARLCGIPEAEIDRAFHKRKGYGEPCDIIE